MEKWVRLGENRTDFFDSMVGVRQGDVLIPNLFKIFINDLPKYLNGSSDPVFLNSLPLDCLMYADAEFYLFFFYPTIQKALFKCLSIS